MTGRHKARKLKSVGMRQRSKILCALLLALLLADIALAHKKEGESKAEKKKEEKEEKKGAKKAPKKTGDKAGKKGGEKEGDGKGQGKEDGGKGTNKKPSQCNKNLLQSFRLEGLDDGEVATDMVACGTVSSKNNCCSKIDEIKIINSWNGYSTPKLDKYADDMVSSYKRVYCLDHAIRTLDAKKGRYHYSEYKWHRTAEEKCYDGKFFVSKTGISKMRAKLNWNEMLAEKTEAFLLNHVIDRIDEYGLLTKPQVQANVQAKLKNNEEIGELLMKLRPGYGMKYTINELEEIYLDKLIEHTQTKIDQSDKKKGETTKKFLSRCLSIREILTEYVKEHYSDKNFRQMQEITAEQHIDGIVKQLSDDKSNLGIPKTVAEAIGEHMKESGDLKKYLGYWVVPSKMKNKDVGKLVFNEMIKSVTETMTKHVDVKKRKYDALVNVLEKIREKVTLEKKLHTTFSHNLNGLITYLLVSNAFVSLAKKNEDSEDGLYETIKEFSFSEATKVEIKHNEGEKYGWDDKKKDLLKLAEKMVTSAAAMAKQTLPNGVKEALAAAWAATKTEILADIDGMKEPTKKESMVCAVVYHSNLYREIHFNQDKLDYCLNAEAAFKNHKVKVDEMVKLIDSLLPQMRAVLELKRGFYCVICDKASNPFLDMTKKKITLGQNFCYSIITQFKKYLAWKNIDFTEYILKAYQFLKCFSDDGTPQKMPFKFFEPSHQSELADVKTCLTMSKKEHVGACLSVCEKFDYTGYSHFFDGERSFIQKIVNFILNVVRTHGFQFQRRVLEALPEMSKEIELEENQVTDKSLTIGGLKGRPDNSEFKKFMNSETMQGPPRQLSSWDRYPDRIHKRRRRKRRETSRRYGRTKRRSYGKKRRGGHRQKHNNRLRRKKRRGRRLKRESKLERRRRVKREKKKKRRDRGLYESELKEINEFDDRFDDDNKYIPKWRHLHQTSTSNNQNSSKSNNSSSNSSSNNSSSKNSTSSSKGHNSSSSTKSSSKASSVKSTAEKAKEKVDKKKAEKKKEEDHKKKEEAKKEEKKEKAKKVQEKLDKKASPPSDEQKPAEVPKKKPVMTIMSISKLLKQLGKMKTYTVSHPMRFDELKHSHRTHNTTQHMCKFFRAIYEVKEAGLDPVTIFQSSNFDKSVAQILVGKSNKKHENFDKHVARSLVCVQKVDIDYFNGEFASPINPAIPENEDQKLRHDHSNTMSEYRASAMESLKNRLSTDKADAAVDGGADGAAKAGDAAKTADPAKAGDAAPTKNSGSRKLYGKLYRKLYKHSGRGGKRRRGKNPVMKALIDFLF